MGVRYPGRAEIDPGAPQAIGICDRCGFQFNLRALQWQYQWAGSQLINLNLLVCETCHDVPNEQLRVLRLPVDPEPLFNVRPENFVEAEKNYLHIQKFVTFPFMFTTRCKMTAKLDSDLGVSPAFSDASDMTAALAYGAAMAPAFSDASDMTAAPLLGIGLTGAFSDASDMTADLEQIVPVAVVVTPTDTFIGQITNVSSPITFTEMGVAIGTAAADRIVVIGITSVSDANLFLTDVTVGGNSASLIRRDEDSTDTTTSELWMIAVPSGTTADIVLELPSNPSFFSTYNVAVWAVYGADVGGSPVVSSNGATVASGAVSASVTPPDDSGTIAAAFTGSSSVATTSSITNATEDFDMSIDYFFYIQNSVFGSREDGASPGSVSISANAASDDVITIKNITIAVFQVP